MARRGWAVLVAAATLWAAGCESGGSGQEAIAPAATVAGCWGAPDDYLNADITEITLRLTAVEHPGAESFTGKLAFVSGGVREMVVRGQYVLGSGDFTMAGETFDFKGKAHPGQIYGTMTHRDDNESINIAWEKEGKGCQGS